MLLFKLKGKEVNYLTAQIQTQMCSQKIGNLTFIYFQARQTEIQTQKSLVFIGNSQSGIQVF